MLRTSPAKAGDTVSVAKPIGLQLGSPPHKGEERTGHQMKASLGAGAFQNGSTRPIYPSRGELLILKAYTNPNR